MHWIDWSIVVLFLALIVTVGICFRSRAEKNVASFFVSGRTLKWYVAGASMIAASFAADTPLWVSALVRQHGIHAVWQYWSPLIGAALGVVLFSRMLRRSNVITDNELLELRYSGEAAATLRAISAGIGALLLCPLTIGWVAKAMATISQEAFGSAGAQFQVAGITVSSELVATLIVMACALIVCALSGLYGIAYADFIQFIIMTAGVFVLAWLSVVEVGGFKSMVDQLSAMDQWTGRGLGMAPSITTQAVPPPGTMSIWNAIGFFFVLWWGNALCGGYHAQRILACEDARHASHAQLMHTIVYFAVLAWPWIIVGMASLIVFPDMGAAGHDAAYPRMILHVLPVGLRGMMISALIAAFISTISTLFNWGSSYIVNDLYRRFLVRNATDTHYVRISRLATLLVALAGITISLQAENIQQLLEIFYVAGSGAVIVAVCRWLWWRINAVGELAALLTNWIVAAVMLFGHRLIGASTPLLDPLMSTILRLPDGTSFTGDYDLLGARMLFMTAVGLVTVVCVSLLTRPVDQERLIEFVRRTQIFEPGWRAVTRDIPNYDSVHTTRATLFDWATIVLTVVCLLFAMASLARYQLLRSAGLFATFGVLLAIVLYRTEKLNAHELSQQMREEI